MTWGNSTKLQKVNIVSNNYSRYGTSVYNTLYSDSYSKNNLNRPKNSYSNTANKATAQVYNERNVTTTVVTKEITIEPKKNTATPNENDNVAVKKSKSNIRSKYKSLITSSSRKLKSKLRDSSSDSFSIFSSKSRHSRKHSISSKKSCKIELFPIIFPEKLADINDLPSELLVHLMEINDCIEINDVLAISLVSKKFNNAAKKILYKDPDFNSTYRVAQFVTSLRLHPENGTLVKSLDLSHLKNGVIPKPTSSEDESTNKEDNTSVRMIGPDYFDDNIAFAGWRDWRHRNDSPMVLNSYNMKRALSRTSSISSMNSSNGNSIITNSPLTNDSRSRGRTRSSSSVSSITSSIMSTFQNGSNNGNGLQSSSISTHSNPSSRSSSRHRNGSIVMMNSRQRTNSSVSLKNNSTTKDTNKAKNHPQKSNNNTNSINSISKWYNMKLRSKNRRNTVTSTLNKEKTPPGYPETESQPSVISSPITIGTNPDTSITSSILLKEKERSPSPLLSSEPILHTSSYQPTTPHNNSLSFILEKPIRSRHPYTSRTLLKYAPYRDLPLGHILHILEHCPNLENINLSNIVLFNDFKVINRTSVRKISSLVLPAVRESEISSSAEDSLEVVYMTDSNKNLENYDQINEDGHVIELRRNSGVTINNSWLTSSTTKLNDYPKPIDSHTKSREDIRRQSKNRDQLLKLNPSIIFETLLNMNNNGTLKFLQMDSSIWCRQYMVKYFILNIFNKKDQCSDYEDKSLSLSFLKSGMNRNFPWSCKGDLHDVTIIIVLDELLKMDDLQIEELYRIKTEKYYESMLKTHDPSIIETSNIFPIKYGETEEDDNHIKFRLTVVKSNKPTSYKISRVTRQNVSLCVRLCINENINRTTSRNEHLPKDPLQRIDRLTHALMAKVHELRSTELRRNIGENNYCRND